MEKNFGVKPTDLRRSNYQAVIQLFRSKSSLTVRDIMDVVSLSKTAIINILNNLSKMGIISSVGKGSSTVRGGKKPELFALNPNYRYVISIAFSHESCDCQLLDLNYKVLDEFSRCATSKNGFSYREIILLAAEAVRSVMDYRKLEPKEVCGIVLHCGGIVLNREGILSRPILAPQWGNDLPVFDDIRPFLPEGIPLFLDNSCRYLGYYELLKHPERRSQNIVTLFCSTSVGGSQIRMGHLVHGLTGLVGEYGHITTDYSFQDRCNCGNYGCFETSVAEATLLRRIRKELKMRSFSSLCEKDLEALTLEDVFQAADEGDSFARKHLDHIVQQFAVLLYNLQIVYDPDEIIIQGIYSKSAAYFQNTLLEIIAQLSLHSIKSHTRLTFSSDCNTKDLHYAMVGSALFCFDQYFEQLDLTV